MATQTATLGLTLPIGTEKVSRAIINGNMQLIDNFAGSTNAAITNLSSRTEIFIDSSKTDANDCVPSANKKYALFVLSQTAAHIPNTVWLFVQAFRAENNYISQIAVSMTGGNKVWSRHFTINGTIPDWDELASESNIISEITPETGTSIHKAIKTGAVVCIIGSCTKITAANTSRNLFTISSSYRPSTVVSGDVTNATASDFGYGQVTLATNGNASIIYSKATTYGVYFTFTYVL